MLSKKKKRIAALLMAMVVSVTTAFSLSLSASAQDLPTVGTTESATATGTDATHENLTEPIVFDHIYNPDVPLYKDFSECELLVKTDPEELTKNTTVASELDGVYLLRFANEEETKFAYSYYYDKAESVDVNETSFAISTDDADSSTVTGDMADLSNINSGEDAFSKVTELPDTNLQGAIALIDTGCSGKNVSKAVSVIGENPADDNGHGTAMYNAITAEYPDAQILSIKALGADGTAQISDIYAALRYAIDSNVKIINLSIAARKTAASGLIDEIIKEATDKGIIVVGAAGNQGRRAVLYVPGGMPEVVTAGACDANGARLKKSNWGGMVDYNVVASSTSEAAAILSAMIDRDGLDKLPVNQGKIFSTDYEKTVEEESQELDTSTDAEPEDQTTENDNDVTAETTEDIVDTTETDVTTETTEVTEEKTGIWDIKDLFDTIFYVQTGSCAGYVSERLGLSYMSTISKLYPYLLSNGYQVVGRGGSYDTSTQDGCNEFSAAVNKIAKPGDIIVFYSEPQYGNNTYQTHIGIVNKVGGVGERESGTNLFTYPTYDYDSTDDKGARTNYSIGRWVYYATSESKKSNSFEILSQRSEIRLQKKSADPECTEGNSCYSLQGAVYNIFSGNTATGTVVATVTTNESGYATVTNLPFGTYTIKEATAPKGYALDTKEYQVTTGATPVTLTVSEQPKMDPISILVTKKNMTGTPVANAQYTVKFYKSVKMDADPAVSGIPVDRTWIFKTDENGNIRFSNNTKWFITGDEFYTFFGAVAMPEGTITIQETSAPAGYVLDQTVYVRQITPGEDASVSTFNEVTVTEETARGDISFMKKNDEGEALANVKFSLTNVETGESHIIWTDETGHYSTSSDYIKHSKDTNSDEAGSGIWFGNEVLDDNRGALPYGTYTLKELRCDANKNKYKDIQPITFTITENNQIYSIGEIINYKFPSISTNVIDTETGTNVAALGDIFAGIDSVHLRDLEIDHQYKLTMKAYSKAKGEYITTNDKSFAATGNQMDVEVDVSFDVTDDLRGTDVVIFEYLIDEAYPDEIISVEEDLSNAGQTIHFPKIETTFTDDVTGDHIAMADKVVQHTDKVDYKDLLVGKSYKTVAELYFTDNGETVKDADGNAITREVEFTPEEPDGTVGVTFEFDASLLAGRSIVAFETIYLDGKKVAAHADLTDEGQTIHYPKVETTFTDDVTGNHIATADKMVQHTDKVDYTNLLVGKTYKTVAELYFSDNGEQVTDADGNAITQEVELTPEEPNGTVGVTFEFDASLLAGRSIVAFETIYLDGKKVAAHADLTDEGQTITYPPTPTPPHVTPPTPKTGDETRLLLPIVLGLVAVAGIVIMIRLKKKHK